MIDVVSKHDPAGPGGPVELHLFIGEELEHQAARLRTAAEAGLDVMGSRIGPYPHDTLTVVASPFWAAAVGGMEYPTLITGVFGDPMWDGALLSDLRLVEVVVAHEFAHQYFPFLIGSNEFEEAYMDEGFTQYWGNEIMISLYGDEGGFGKPLGRRMDVSALETSGLSQSGAYPRPVWSRPSFLARHSKAFSQFYTIPAVTMATAARIFGQSTVDRVFSAYFDRWAFGHPRFEDFLVVAREAGGDDFADFVRESYTQERLPDYRVKSLKTEEWKRARGRLVTAEGVIEPDAEETEELELAGLDEAARDPGEVITVEILDPGWNRGGELRTGSIERRELIPGTEDADEDWEVEERVFHHSTVRVEGSGWHWRLRIYGMLWAAPELADLRERPDEPWHVFRKLYGRIRRRWPGAAAAEIETETPLQGSAAEEDQEVNELSPVADEDDISVEAEDA